MSINQLTCCWTAILLNPLTCINQSTCRCNSFVLKPLKYINQSNCKWNGTYFSQFSKVHQSMNMVVRWWGVCLLCLRLLSGDLVQGGAGSQRWQLSRTAGNPPTNLKGTRPWDYDWLKGVWLDRPDISFNFVNCPIILIFNC